MLISVGSSDVCSSDLAAAVEGRRLDRRVSGSAGEVGLGLGMALQAGVGGGAVEQRHRLLAAELEGASEVDRSLHVLVAVEMAKAAVGPGGGETGVMVDRGVEVGHGAGEIDRKSVVEGTGVSVRVDFGGRRIL